MVNLGGAVLTDVKAGADRDAAFTDDRALLVLGDIPLGDGLALIFSDEFPIDVWHVRVSKMDRKGVGWSQGRLAQAPAAILSAAPRPCQAAYRRGTVWAAG